MGRAMDTWNFLFSFRGRIQRADFWLLAFAALAMWVAILVVVRLMSPATAWISWFIFFLRLALFIAGLAVWFSAATRRLHDRDKSAWYLFLFFGLPSLLQTMFGDHRPGDTVFVLIQGEIGGSFVDFLCLMIGLWMIVELGFLRGIPGPNKYDAEPLTAPETHPV
jgi:uncharacterized membrane protein YhaH (DUF805 family)